MNKIGRNAKCPCGFGLKYKKCCWNKTTYLQANNNSAKTNKGIKNGGFLNKIFAEKSIQNVNKYYTLAGNINIQQDYVRVEGIHVRGDMTIKNSKGVQLKEMNIQSRKEDGMAGNINIDDSNEFIMSENIVSGDLNIGSKNTFKLDKNLIGFSFEDDQKIIDALNVLLLSNANENEIENSLHIIQETISKNNEIAKKVSEILKIQNEKRNKSLSTIILQTLRVAGISTLKLAESKGVELALNWLITALGIKLDK